MIGLLLRFMRSVFVRGFEVEGMSWFHQFELNVNAPWSQQCNVNEAAICCTINVLELLDKHSNTFVIKNSAQKMSNKLFFGNRRDHVKFLSKRLPCSCLKELHRSARQAIGKEGMCFRCYKMRPS